MTDNLPQRITPEAAEVTVQDMIRDGWGAIAASLPKTVDDKRFARLVFNAVRLNTDLAKASSASIIGAILTASALGLEIGIDNEAHLVPYRRTNKHTGKQWVEASLIVGYGGLVKLFRQHPMARGVTSGWVGANDKFDFAYGTGGYLNHTPSLGDRGKPIAFWAAYELADGTRDFLVLSPAEVAALRGRSGKGDIPDPQHWMERKTVLKQVLKLAPKSTNMAWAVAVDEQPGSNLQKTHLAIAAEAPPTVDMATGEIQEPGYPEPDYPQEG